MVVLDFCSAQLNYTTLLGVVTPRLPALLHALARSPLSSTIHSVHCHIKGTIRSVRCVSALMGLVTVTFDLLTLKLVCESDQRWRTFLPNLGTLGLWVLELFAMYATDRRTDGQNQQKQCLLPPSLRAGHNKLEALLSTAHVDSREYKCNIHLYSP